MRGARQRRGGDLREWRGSEHGAQGFADPAAKRTPHVFHSADQGSRITGGRAGRECFGASVRGHDTRRDLVAATHARDVADDERLCALALGQLLHFRLREKCPVAEPHSLEPGPHGGLAHHANGAGFLKIHSDGVRHRAGQRRIRGVILELRDEHDVVRREHVVADECPRVRPARTSRLRRPQSPSRPTLPR
jgi:hypothetical protein